MKESEAKRKGGVCLGPLHLLLIKKETSSALNTEKKQSILHQTLLKTNICDFV